MCEQEKKRRRIYDLLNAETKPKNSEITGLSLSTVYKAKKKKKKKKLQKKSFLRKIEGGE